MTAAVSVKSLSRSPRSTMPQALGEGLRALGEGLLTPSFGQLFRAVTLLQAEEPDARQPGQRLELRQRERALAVRDPAFRLRQPGVALARRCRP